MPDMTRGHRFGPLDPDGDPVRDRCGYIWPSVLLAPEVKCGDALESIKDINLSRWRQDRRR